MSANDKKLRRGWTTGACASAAAKTACVALKTGVFADPVEITLPGGQTPAFALARHHLGENWASASIIKDAGDDPDVTHGALISVKLSPRTKGAGVLFVAGDGVGTITLPGLPLPPGEPAINPVPRQMILAALKEITPDHCDYEVEISIENGTKLAEKTLNGRLGIKGGLSILGTTGIVIPFSCAAWIDSIHRGLDVARATGHEHVAGSTGSTSEKAVQNFHALDQLALIEMGDFVGGLLKYARTHPVKRLTIAGGVAKMTKLAQGMLDVHSKRGTADFEMLAALASAHNATPDLAEKIRDANTVAQVFELAARENFPLGDLIATRAWQTAATLLAKTDMELEILLFDRNGILHGHHPFKKAQTIRL
ncbi:MAG: cobalt-precorrin-5B (C(1))-methyltransferase [Hyphomicrobiaceae bacterium]|nr:cobalt-precorrin-5B (C(1))-methyltransferase [Hyphomicrobiaceae bacterium]